MKIFKLLATLAGFAIISISASAQMKDPNQMARQHTDHIKQTVTGITPDEESQIFATELEYTKSVQNVFNTTDASDKVTIHNKVKPLRESRDAKMKTILTADQYSQYEQSKPEYHSVYPSGK